MAIRAFQETCFKFWQEGVVSTETLLDTHGYDLTQEFERREKENEDGVDAVMFNGDEHMPEGQGGKLGRPNIAPEDLIQRVIR